MPLCFGSCLVVSLFVFAAHFILGLIGYAQEISVEKNPVFNSVATLKLPNQLVYLRLNLL
jgi:hypothetical protein